MKRLAIAMILTSCLLAAGSASAGPAGPAVSGLRGALAAAVPVPPEWDGVWTTQDSLYDCSGASTGTSTSTDTLCTGQSTYEPPADPLLTFTCDGTADADEFHVTCSGSAELFPNCQMSIEIRTDGTLTGSSFFSVTTITTSYSGTGEGCDFLPGSCQQINSHGTRTGPAPSEYCATPARPASWGELKARYR
jgi:hypothetical protein